MKYEISTYYPASKEMSSTYTFTITSYLYATISELIDRLGLPGIHINQRVEKQAATVILKWYILWEDGVVNKIIDEFSFLYSDLINDNSEEAVIRKLKNTYTKVNKWVMSSNGDSRMSKDYRVQHLIHKHKTPSELMNLVSIMKDR